MAKLMSHQPGIVREEARIESLANAVGATAALGLADTVDPGDAGARETRVRLARQQHSEDSVDGAHVVLPVGSEFVEVGGAGSGAEHVPRIVIVGRRHIGVESQSRAALNEAQLYAGGHTT